MFPCALTVRYCLLLHSGSDCKSVVVLSRVAQDKRKKRTEEKRREEEKSRRASVFEPWPQSQPVLHSVLDTPDGLDLRGLTVGAPVPPVLVVSTVSLTLHYVLLAPVARVLVAHKTVAWIEKVFSACLALLAGL